MDKRRLGKTDIEITPIGLGCWQFSEGATWMSRVWQSIGQDAIDAVVRAAIARTAPLVGELRSIARSHGATPAQAALSWAVTFHGDTVVAIPGATRPAQAEQNAAAMDLHLSTKELARLDELSRQSEGR